MQTSLLSHTISLNNTEDSHEGGSVSVCDPVGGGSASIDGRSDVATRWPSRGSSLHSVFLDEGEAGGAVLFVRNTFLDGANTEGALLCDEERALLLQHRGRSRAETWNALVYTPTDEASTHGDADESLACSPSMAGTGRVVDCGEANPFLDRFDLLPPFDVDTTQPGLAKSTTYPFPPGRQRRVQTDGGFMNTAGNGLIHRQMHNGLGELFGLGDIVESGDSSASGDTRSNSGQPESEFGERSPAAIVVLPAAGASSAHGPVRREDVTVGHEVPQEEGSLPSIGSAGHRFRECKPCAFLDSKIGCVRGALCTYCHLCDPGEKKRRQKEKRRQLISRSKM